MEKESCWGCHLDYLQLQFGDEELVPIEHEGETIKVCPYCAEELFMDYDF